MCAADGIRAPSPYVEPRAGNAWWCLACECSLDNAQHLEKRRHKTNAWYWCFGCTDLGYEQRARAPDIVWETQEITPKFWSNSPTDDAPQQFAHAAQQAQQQHHQLLAPYAAVAGGIHEPPGLDPAADVHMRSRSSAAPSGVEEHKSSIDKVQQAIDEQQSSIVELKKVVEELVQEAQGIKKIITPPCTLGARACSCSASAGYWPALPSGPQEPDGRHDA